MATINISPDSFQQHVVSRIRRVENQILSRPVAIEIVASELGCSEESLRYLLRDSTSVTNRRRIVEEITNCLHDEESGNWQLKNVYLK